MSNPSKKRWHFWPARLLVVLVVLAAIVLATVAIIRRVYTAELQPVGSSQQAHSVTVPSGASVKEIALLLKQNNLIRQSWAFEWYVRNHGLRDKLQAGTYSLKPSMGVNEIVDILTHGKVRTNLVTIYPGQRLNQIRASFINDYGWSAQAVDKALDPTLYANHPALVDKPVNASLEGYLYPDSFQRTADTRPETIIRLSLDEMQKRLTPPMRASIEKQGLTVYQGIILASIVEQEVNRPEDRPIVAQIFLLRLRKGIALGSDVTAIYGAIKDGLKINTDNPESIAKAILNDSPYNTRKHTGLPPGPLSNVTQDALNAVAHPAGTDFLYFVAGDPDAHGNSTKTYFARTLAEHEANVREHCKEQC